jgi:hypothetical protein
LNNFFQQIIGSEVAVYIDKLLPHIETKYIILCYDVKAKQFYAPGEMLSKMQEYDIKYAPADGRNWYALISNTNAQNVKITNTFTGKLIMQLRQLERIGYIPISVSLAHILTLFSSISN